jgi:hypothetical protein
VSRWGQAGDRGYKRGAQGRCLEFGSDGTPLYVPEEAGGEGHTLFKRSLIFNSTSRVAGSIDQEYLQQIVRDFNRCSANTLDNVKMYGT